jgi:hypothetical protein
LRFGRGGFRSETGRAEKTRVKEHGALATEEPAAGGAAADGFTGLMIQAALLGERGHVFNQAR